MKNIVKLSLVTLALFSLAACSSKTSEKAESKESSSQSSSVVKKSKVDNSKFDSIISELKSQLDPQNEGGWDYKITNEVTNENISNGTSIDITPTEQSGTDNIKKIYDGADSGDMDSQAAKLSLQKIVSDVAKKLPDDNSQINLGYSIDGDNSVLLAASTKTKDIVPLD